MRENVGRFCLSALLTTLLAFVLAAPSARAEAAISSVSVAEGTDYTNVTVSVATTDISSFTVKVLNAAGTQLGDPINATVSASPTSVPIDLGSRANFKKGNVYFFEVSAEGATTVTASYLVAGWQTNVYFSAEVVTNSVEGGWTSNFVNGAWLTPEPEVADGAFKINTTQAVFQVETATELKTGKKIVALECYAKLDSYYFLDDLTNDFTNAICAVALVTNEETTVDVAWNTSWMVLANGTNWVAMESSDDLLKLTNYIVRVEIDYADATPMARYSVKTDDDDASWTTLTHDSKEWIEIQTDPANLTKVGFAGSADLVNFAATLSTTNIAVVGGTEYALLTNALEKAGSSEITLLTNTSVDSRDLTKAGTYTFNVNGKSLALLDTLVYTKTDTTGKKCTWDATTGTLTVEVGVKLAAQIGDYRYLTISNACLKIEADSIAKTNILVLCDCFDNVTCPSGKDVTIDLDGHTIRRAQTKWANVFLASGPGTKLTLTGGGSVTTNGLIRWDADSSKYVSDEEGVAIVSKNGAVVVIDGIFVTNYTAEGSVLADFGGEVYISNGWFQASGAISANSEVCPGTEDVGSKIKIAGGYFADFENCELAFQFEEPGVIEATGGKFTTNMMVAATNVLVEPEVYTSILARGYKFVEFAQSVTTNGQTFAWEIMTNLTASGSVEVPTKVWNVSDSEGNTSIGGVQLPDAFSDSVVDDPASATPEQKQAALNADAPYNGGTKKMKKWQCYVLGMPDAAKPGATTTTEGPYVKGVQDNKPGVIGFQMLTPEAVKAKESGCDVKFEVEEYDAPTGGNKTGTSGKVDYDAAAEITAPSSGVKYYKLKVSITPKK